MERVSLVWEGDKVVAQPDSLGKWQFGKLLDMSAPIGLMMDMEVVPKDTDPWRIGYRLGLQIMQPTPSIWIERPPAYKLPTWSETKGKMVYEPDIKLMRACCRRSKLGGKPRKRYLKIQLPGERNA
jgi:hypothetical protein